LAASRQKRPVTKPLQAIRGRARRASREGLAPISIGKGEAKQLGLAELMKVLKAPALTVAVI
jgi:hypothetical protein